MRVPAWPRGSDGRRFSASRAPTLASRRRARHFSPWVSGLRLLRGKFSIVFTFQLRSRVGRFLLSTWAAALA